MSVKTDMEYLTCRLGGAIIGIRLLWVQEVFETRFISRLPNCPAYIKGMVNVRGALVPVVDCWELLDNCPGIGKIVILNSSEGKIGVLISELLDIIRVNKTRPAKSPPQALESYRSCFPVMTLSPQTIYLLDLEPFIRRLIQPEVFDSHDAA